MAVTLGSFLPARRTQDVNYRAGMRVTLRFEALVVLAAALALYGAVGMGWWTFALLFFVPDLGMLGYLWNVRVGALTYNAMHCEAGPAIVGAIGVLAAAPPLYGVALIWLAHISFDRALGYGLKSLRSFRETHLGEIGGRSR